MLKSNSAFMSGLHAANDLGKTLSFNLKNVPIPESETVETEADVERLINECKLVLCVEGNTGNTNPIKSYSWVVVQLESIEGIDIKEHDVNINGEYRIYGKYGEAVDAKPVMIYNPTGNLDFVQAALPHFVTHSSIQVYPNYEILNYPAHAKFYATPMFKWLDESQEPVSMIADSHQDLVQSHHTIETVHEYVTTLTSGIYDAKDLRFDDQRFYEWRDGDVTKIYLPQPDEPIEVSHPDTKLRDAMSTLTDIVAILILSTIPLTFVVCLFTSAKNAALLTLVTAMVLFTIAMFANAVAHKAASKTITIVPEQDLSRIDE